jgi:hypothetical protein
MAAYRDVSSEARESLYGRAEELILPLNNAAGVTDNGALAVCALALDAIAGESVFEMRA